MGQKIGIIYSSVDGQTKKICESLRTFFNNKQLETKLYKIDDFNDNLSEFHTIIIGASIRYGKHSKNVTEFIQHNRTDLDTMRTAFFSVNLVARNIDKNSADTNPYLIKFLKSCNWKPKYLEVFAGKLDYKAYGFLDRLMIKFIMKLTKGPTKTDKPIEFTNWTKVYNFGLMISKDLNVQH